MALAGFLTLSLSLVVGLSGQSSAYLVTVEPNMWYVDTVPGMWVVEPVERVSFSWSSDIPLKLSVSGPSGLIKTYEAATSGSDSINTDNGVLYFTWLNTNSVNATLEYSFNVETVSEHMMVSFLVAILLIVAVIVVGVIVAVYLVVRSLNKGSSRISPSAPVPPPPPYAPPGAVVAPMDKCPGCGSKVNPVTRICPGCGARVL